MFPFPKSCRKESLLDVHARIRSQLQDNTYMEAEADFSKYEIKKENYGMKTPG